MNLRILLKSSHFKYALTYILVTFMALLFLNVYSTEMNHKLFIDGIKRPMLDRCEQIATEIGNLDTIDATNIVNIILKYDKDKLSRLVITDIGGTIVYDYGDPSVQIHFSDAIVSALKRNSVFYSDYHSGAITSCSATPIYSGITLIGSVYIVDVDRAQGSLIETAQKYILIVSLLLAVTVVAFSLIYSRIYSSRLKKITTSMQAIREGNYAEGVDIGGNDELTVLGDAFNDLIARLQVSEEKRNHFVSDASHELKTPLASIKLLSDSILQNDMDVVTIREFVGDIGNEADRLTRMSEKLLSLTRLEVEEEDSYEIVYMAPTVERVMRMLVQLAEKRNITLQADLTNDCTILIMEDDLYEIVFNLVENAIKYNIDGGKVFISLNRVDDNALLTVEDTGVGIPADAQKHVFERFFRVDKARSRKSGGSGLGLSIVRNMVERNQGTICVESTVGTGSKFTLSFPVFDAN